MTPPAIPSRRRERRPTPNAHAESAGNDRTGTASPGAWRQALVHQVSPSTNRPPRTFRGWLAKKSDWKKTGLCRSRGRKASHSSGDSRRENTDAHPHRCLTTESELARLGLGTQRRPRCPGGLTPRSRARLLSLANRRRRRVLHPGAGRPDERDPAAFPIRAKRRTGNRFRRGQANRKHRRYAAKRDDGSDESNILAGPQIVQHGGGPVHGQRIGTRQPPLSERNHMFSAFRPPAF